MTLFAPFSSPARAKALLAATPVYNQLSPFLVDNPVLLVCNAGGSVYGANHPGVRSTTKYAKFKQTITGNKAFSLPTGVTAPLQTVSGALADADQLRVVALVNGVISKGARADQVAAAGTFVVGSGGGTAVADATVIVKGTTAANIAAGATSLSVASTGSDTQTIIVGDLITIAGDSTVYRATATSTALNGTTEVLLPITPPLQAATTASTVITVATSDDRTVIFGTAPALNVTVEVFVLASTDITTISGGALTAARIYETPCFTFMHAGALTNMTPAVR